MILYIRQTKKIKLLYRILNVLKLENIENKHVICLPMNSNTKKRRTEKVIDKLSKYLYNNNIKSVVLENDLMQNEVVKNILYSNNIHIIDGTKITKFLIYDLIQKIYEYKNKRIESGEITLLVNENNEINMQTIKMIAHNVKRLNIITNNIKKFRKVVDYLYNEIGILIKLSNNIKTNLTSSDIIINIDFPEEIVNKFDIPNDATIINVTGNINIKSKRFSGINIKSWEIKVPTDYKIDGFDETIIYEASIYEKQVFKIFEQIKSDNIKIGKLIGVNGVINPNEFKR